MAVANRAQRSHYKSLKIVVGSLWHFNCGKVRACLGPSTSMLLQCLLYCHPGTQSNTAYSKRYCKIRTRLLLGFSNVENLGFSNVENFRSIFQILMGHLFTLLQLKNDSGSYQGPSWWAPHQTKGGCLDASIRT